MLELWVVTAEIVVERGDLPSGNTNAFVNVVTWADSSSHVEQKVRQYLESYEWSLVSIEDAHPFDEARSYSDKVLDTVEQAKNNPQACIIVEAFSYKPE
jgi:hypothetical protein